MYGNKTHARNVNHDHSLIGQLPVFIIMQRCTQGTSWEGVSPMLPAVHETSVSPMLPAVREASVSPMLPASVSPMLLEASVSPMLPEASVSPMLHVGVREANI